MTQLIPKANPLGSGSITLDTPNTNSARVLTLPDETGTLLSTGSAVRTQKGVPAFSAYQSVVQTIATGTATKIQFQAEEYDTTGAFDSATNYRFQPTVAGYYHLTAGFLVPTASRSSEVQFMLYKNGSIYKSGQDQTATSYLVTANCHVYLNGSTDYVEAYIWLGTGGTTTVASYGTYFQGILIAAA